MRKILVLIFLFVSVFSSIGQIDRSLFKGAHNVFSIEDNGFLLLNRELYQMSNGDLAIKLMKIDNQLLEQWSNTYPFSKGFGLAYQKLEREGLVFVFTNENRNKLDVILANTGDGTFERVQYDFTEPILINESAVYFDNIWVSGAIGGKPALFKLLPNGKYETMPIGVPGLLKYVGDLSFNRDTKSLDYTLMASIQNQDVIIWRSIGLNGEIEKNETLKGFNKIDIRALKSTVNNNEMFVAGLYSKQGKDRNEGVFIAKIGEQSTLRLYPNKEVEAISSFKREKDILTKNPNKLNKFKVLDKHMFIDGLFINTENEFQVGIEVYSPDFRNRGTLEQQFIARDRTAQLDQNTFGARNGLDERNGFEQRAEQFSATDQMQYRFMNQSLGKAINQGLRYNHTGIITFDKSLQLSQAPGIQFEIKDSGRFAQSNNFSDHLLKYYQDGKFHLYNTVTNELNVYETSEGNYVLPLEANRFLKVSYSKERNETTLFFDLLK